MVNTVSLAADRRGVHICECMLAPPLYKEYRLITEYWNITSNRERKMKLTAIQDFMTNICEHVKSYLQSPFKRPSHTIHRFPSVFH